MYVIESSTDYVKYSDGTAIAYSYVYHSAGGYDWSESCTFPITFAEAPNVVCTPIIYSGSGCLAFTGTVSTTGCTIYQQSKTNAAGKSYYVKYIAIGKWK